MKKINLLLVALILTMNAMGQNLNFATTVYFSAADSSTSQGTVLTSSGSFFSTFNYSAASGTEAVFTSGIYFPVSDCQNNNLWVRFRHIAADPNGTANGFNVSQTLNNPCYAGDTVIGGFWGFVYDIRIFSDQNLTGMRSNILDTLFPTNVTVESLETLFNNVANAEWLSFIIVNPESTGWNLNSINFTGLNTNSNPGFTNITTYTGPGNSFPPAFTPVFPTGNDTVYAISLSTAPNYSEFRMSASNVSRFYYRYEFNSGGYQGMSMKFGTAPVATDSTVDVMCHGAASGEIYVDVSGSGPYDFIWNNGATTQNLINVIAGNYSVTINDVAGCYTISTDTLHQPVDSMAITIQTINSTQSQSTLLCSIIGGFSPYTYLWNTGATTDSIVITANGIYTVTVTDQSGCAAIQNKNYNGFTAISPDGLNQSYSIYPNPASNELQINYHFNSQGTLQLYNVLGQQKLEVLLAPHSNSKTISLTGLQEGIYIIWLKGDSNHIAQQKLIIEK